MTAMDTSGRGAAWDVGSVIGTAASTLFGHFVPFVGTALVASLPSLLFTIFVPDSRGQSIVDFIVGQIVTVTLVYGTVPALRGRQVSISECLSQGLKRLGAAIGVGILTGIGIVLGAVFFLVPGFILATMWAVAIPAATIEQKGVMLSISRSSDLTRERRWRVFGAFLVSTLITLAVGAVVGAIAGVIGGEHSVTFSVVLWAVTATSQAFSACVVATLYYFLRREKEGVDIDEIASVFD